MTSWRYSDSRWSDRLAAPINWSSKLALIAVMVALLALVAAAVTIARSEAVREIAADARVMTATASVSTAVAVLNGEIGQGIVVGQTARLGVLEEEASIEAAARIRQASAQLGQQVGILVEFLDHEGVVAIADSVERHAAAVADALEQSDVEAARLIVENHLGQALAQLSMDLEVVSQESAGRIAAVDAGLVTITTAARFVAALLIPGLAVFLLYRALRGSQRASLLKSELERERELRHKMKAFVAATSHQIAAPLSAAVTFAEHLRDGSNDFNYAAREEFIHLVTTEAEEISEVLADLTIAARLDTGDFDLDSERVELRDVVDRVTADWADKQVMTLSVAGNAVVIGDDRLLAHALHNLLRNVVSSGGEQVRIEIRSAGDRALVEVSDDGAVLPGDVNARISETYYSNDEDGGLASWQGLGLSVARRIAKTLGGDLRYQRQEQENVLQMSLPAARTQLLARDAYTRLVDPARGKPTYEEIEKVIADGGPDMVYQPIFDLTEDRHNDVVGYEALARFGSNDPADWFQAASMSGIGTRLELACLRAAIDGFYPHDGESFLAVNVSDATLRDPRLESAVEGIEGRRLVFEISPADPMPSYEATRLSLDPLIAEGARLAITNYGIEDLDVVQMARLGARIIKIDISRMRSLPDSGEHRAFVVGLAAISETLGISLVGERVETEEEHSAVVNLGVGFGQGNYYASPEALGKPDRNRPTAVPT